MAKETSDALEILRRDREKDPERQRLYEEEKINLQIALLIRDVREKAGLTQKQLADRVGTAQSVISRLEDADYEGHSISMLQRIASALKKRISIKMDAIEEDKDSSRSATG